MSMASIFCNRCGSPNSDDVQFCQQCGAILNVGTEAPITPTPPGGVVRYAGFWIRVVSAIIDMVLLLTVFYPVRLLLGSAVTSVGVDSQMSMHEMFLLRRVIRFGIGIALAWAYRAGMESSHYQATLGKMVLRLKVTGVEGSRITLARATARYFAKYVSTITLGIGYLMVAFDEQKKGLHDRIAGTLVSYRDNS